MFCPKCGIENLNTSRFCKKCGKNLPDASQIRQTATLQFSYAAPQTAGLIGQVLDGKYRIETKLGSGGMGDVYRATRLLIGDSVAIKVLHTHLARDAQAAERFRREAVTATQLRHRNIVALFDVGISAAHNVPFILMELAEGFSLRQIINQYRVLPLDFVVTVTAQLCAALDEAHRLGIVHRDIKPENIIANQTATGWHVKVLDFGIAKLYNQTELGLTQDGSAMGTPQYMSPEQCMGEPLDGRSDLYSVGILLYEMLAGTVPFKSPAASAVAVHQVQTPPPPPRSINPNIAPQVEQVVLRALDKRREMRQQTALQLSQEMIQAATVAFKSGLAAVSATPIPAPDVEPEFDAGGEPESSPVQSSNTLSSEILVENQSAKNSAALSPDKSFKVTGIDEPDNSFRGIPEIPVSEKLSYENNQKAGSENVPVQTPEVALSEITNDPDEGSEKENLSLVFEDAEHILDEMFPNKTDEISGSEKPTESKTEDFQISQPIRMPDEALPEIDNSPADVLAKYSAETIVPGNFQAVNSPSGLPENINIDSDENVLSNEIQTKPRTKMFLVLGGIGLALFIFLVGIIGLGWWFFSGAQKTQTAANSNLPVNPQIAPPTGMVFIPGGEFMMGNDTGDEFSRPAHKVSVKPFFMDLTEVTNEEYKKFVDAAAYKPPSNWENNNFSEGKAKFPVTGVDWDAANAYAKWAGKRLPTEEEWEFAARGADNLIYPWGNDWKKEFANADRQNSGTTEVGKSAGKSPFGLVDMSGNAWEWTATDAKSYPNGKMLPNQSIEPKIIRGGYFGSSKDKATTFFRRPYGARGETNGYENTGFRCVRDSSDK